MHDIVTISANHSVRINMGKNCVCCNNEISENAHTCTCGHVYVEKKLIRGKRYSAYREELYSKLMTTKNRLAAGSKSKSGKESNRNNHENITKVRNRPYKQRKTNSTKHRRRQKHGGQVKQARSTGISAAEIAQEKFESYWANRCDFAFALEEINRRFSKQSLFWVRL